MYFYSLVSKSQERYNVPFLAMDDDDAISRVSQMVTGSQDPSLILSLDDLQLCCVGLFEPSIEDPCIVGFERSQIVLDDLHDKLPLPPLVRDKVDKLYGLEVKDGESDG